MFSCLLNECWALPHGGQRMTCRSPFSPSTMGVLGIRFKSAGLVASDSTHWAILLVLYFIVVSLHPSKWWDFQHFLGTQKSLTHAIKKCCIMHIPVAKLWANKTDENRYFLMCKNMKHQAYIYRFREIPSVSWSPILF